MISRPQDDSKLKAPAPASTWIFQRKSYSNEKHCSISLKGKKYVVIKSCGAKGAKRREQVASELLVMSVNRIKGVADVPPYSSKVKSK